MTLISSFLQNLNPTTKSLERQNFIFIVLQELWNYMEFNLLMTLHDSLIIILTALTLLETLLKPC